MSSWQALALLPACPDVMYVVYQSREMKAGGQMAAPSATYAGPEVKVWSRLDSKSALGVIAPQHHHLRQSWTLSGTRIPVQAPLLPLAVGETPSGTFSLP